MLYQCIDTEGNEEEIEAGTSQQAAEMFLRDYPYFIEATASEEVRVILTVDGMPGPSETIDVTVDPVEPDCHDAHAAHVWAEIAWDRSSTQPWKTEECRHCTTQRYTRYPDTDGPEISYGTREQSA